MDVIILLTADAFPYRKVLLNLFVPGQHPIPEHFTQGDYSA